MKTLINFILIGVVQGITEFLPISSSGHIVLLGSFFEMDNLLLLSVVAHVGTLFAVLFCYRKKLKELIKKPFCETNIKLLIATIPTIVTVLLFNNFLEDNFSKHALVWGFLISAILLLIADLKKNTAKPINKRRALVMGVSQGFALLPGISRSGTTLAFGLLTGADKKEVLDFSFLMSIPIIIASAVYETVKLTTSTVAVNWVCIFIVMITSFVFGIISIKLMLKVVKNNKLYFFSFYLIALSLLMLFFV